LSFEIAATATGICLVVGLALSLLIAGRRFPGRDLIDVLVAGPIVLPPTVLGYYTLVLVGRRSALGTAFEHVTGSSIVFTKTGAVLAACIGALPIIMKSSTAALESVDPVFVRAARTLGATPLRAFLTVQIPLAAPGIVAAVMLAFARALGDFGITLMVAGDIPGETRTASLAIYDAIQSSRESDALFMVFVLTTTAVLVLYGAGKLTKAFHVG
jgi:molybdate transport system permease protein